MRLTLIAALTWPGRVIGRENRIPWHLAEDLKRFKALTSGHPVVMGRNTWESLPFKLPGRFNLVVSSRPLETLAKPKGALPDAVAESLEAAVERARSEAGGEDVFVIGGARLYAAALPLAERLVLTLVHRPFEGDVLFPAWNAQDWRETHREIRGADEGAGFAYEFLELHRTRSKGAS
jgi:dihydrofolate reductase